MNDFVRHGFLPESHPEYVAEVANVPFWMGRPEYLPSSSKDVRSAVSEHARGIVSTLDRQSSWKDVGTILDAARAVSRQLCLDDHEPVNPDEEASEANRANDLAFGIVRVHGSVPRLLADAGVAALIGILEVAADRGSDLDEASWRKILGGFNAMFAWLADPDAEVVPRDMPSPSRSLAEPVAGEALRRWVRGHHVFMVFAQASVLVMECLGDSARRGDLISGVAAGSAAVQLMRACQGSLRYAGDAKHEEYNSEIRLTLMPPVAPPKMSGLHWRDHEALIRTMSASKSAWEWLAKPRPDIVEDFRSALNETYVSHMGVCEKFVGPDNSSLLAAGRSSRSAVGVIDQLRRIRMRSVSDPAEAEGDDVP